VLTTGIKPRPAKNTYFNKAGINYHNKGEETPLTFVNKYLNMWKTSILPAASMNDFAVFLCPIEFRSS
jgi:hypothetical protein